MIIVSDYHPASVTVADRSSGNAFARSARTLAPQQTTDSLEAMTWNYIVQIANGIKAIHSVGLAARCIDIGRILVTDENRIRLNGCAINDLFDNEPLGLEELQRRDFYDFGRFLLAAAMKQAGHASTRARAPDPFSKCSDRLKAVMKWLMEHNKEGNNGGIEEFLDWISPLLTDAFDASLRLDDELQSNLARELENSRIVRLTSKINCLIARPEYDHDRLWSPQGPRAVITLFRDYVYHQVDAQGNPVVDLGHILACLNKLDAGVEEKVQLITRDEANVILVTYKDVKAEIDRAWQELMRRSAN